jgi:hypothetical protein
VAELGDGLADLLGALEEIGERAVRDRLSVLVVCVLVGLHRPLFNGEALRTVTT